MTVVDRLSSKAYVCTFQVEDYATVEHESNSGIRNGVHSIVNTALGIYPFVIGFTALCLIQINTHSIIFHSTSIIAVDDMHD